MADSAQFTENGSAGAGPDGFDAAFYSFGGPVDNEAFGNATDSKADASKGVGGGGGGGGVGGGPGHEASGRAGDGSQAAPSSQQLQPPTNKEMEGSKINASKNEEDEG